jgi:hypothetical protein
MNQQANLYSKESIKARMLNNAALLWGIKNPQALDPFVKLLIDAFSTEIFKVGNEVSNIKTRILEKLARLLTPTPYTLPQPAHAIANACSVEPISLLKKNTEFFNKKQLASASKELPDAQVQLAFTPIDTVKLFNAKMTAIVTGNWIFSIDKELNKFPVQKSKTGPLPYGSMWIAIEFTDDAIAKLEELPLCFLSSDYEHLEWIYSLLPFAQIQVGEHKLSITAGLKYETLEQKEGFEEIFNEYSTEKKIQDNIKNIYKQYFITLSNFPKNLIDYTSTFPEVLRAHFDTAITNNHFTEKYIWLELKFPPQYSFEVLENFKVNINCFPIINRKWKQNECKFDIAGNNIPLTTTLGEHFLLVDEVMDGAGRKFTEIPYSHAASLNKGLYTIRVGGMERFDERNAIDLIDHVLELTRDEVASYSTLGRDNVVTALQVMVTQMKYLERKSRLASGFIKQVPTYVIVEPYEQKEYMYSSYWVTHCTLANNLRSGTILHDARNTALQSGNITLLTKTVGGEQQQTGMDAIQAYRYALTTRDRIVTIEDIKNFCKLELRSLLKDIEIKKGTAISEKPKEGFIRTIDIIITAHDYTTFTESYWQSRGKALIQQIEARSVDGISYRIFFKQE